MSVRSRSVAVSLKAKIAASAVLVAGAAGAAGLGTFGSFTSTTSSSQSVAAGTVAIGLGTTDPTQSAQVSGLVPGDSIQRTITLSNVGSQDFASIALTTSAPDTTSLLDSDATRGLQMSVQSCPTAWVGATGSDGSGVTYSCVGGRGGGSPATQVLGSRPVLGSSLALPSLNAVTAGGSSYLLITMVLPSTANNSFQNLTSVINFRFDALQRGGAAH